MPSNLNLRIRFAYIEFKRKLLLVSTLYFIAMLLGFTLFIYSELVYTNQILRIWAIFLVFLLFVKVFFDFWNTARIEYESKFKERVR